VNDDASILDKIGLNGLIDFIYPPVCLNCGCFLDDSRDLICAGCLDKIAELDFPFCSQCHSFLQKGLKCADCGDSALPIFCLGHFTDVLQKIIHQFKYYGFKKLGDDMAGRLLDIYAEQLIKINADFIVPIPLHAIRERLRGFNQAAILADIIGKRIGVPAAADKLVKIRRTRDQARLNPEQRRENIKGAFEVYGDALLNKRIIIVDDVVTTGATVNEAAVTLRAAGAVPSAVCAVAAAGF